MLIASVDVVFTRPRKVKKKSYLYQGRPKKKKKKEGKWTNATEHEKRKREGSSQEKLLFRRSPADDTMCNVGPTGARLSEGGAGLSQVNLKAWFQ